MDRAGVHQNRPVIEIADVLRRHGQDYARVHAVHLGRVERRVMSAITAFRTATLGGHVEACGDRGVTRIAYNSCRNRHCPKCQGQARAKWLAHRQAVLLPVPYFHLVFTLPAPIAEIAFQNRAVAYPILFKAAADAMTTLAANPRRLGTRIGGLAVLHTWGQALTHHPHVHCVVPGGGLSSDGKRWVAARPNFFLAISPLSQLFRRLFLERLQAAFEAGTLGFFNKLTHLADREPFAALVQTMRRIDWVVYPKKPFGGPAQVLAYLGRYTHRVAIANSRLVALDDDHVAFTWKDYRQIGAEKIMRLKPDEFIRRFLFPTLPDGFHPSDTSDLWPMAAAPKTSHRAARCSAMKNQRTRQGLCRRPRPAKTPSTPSASAQIAAEPCGSSSACLPHHRAATLPGRHSDATRHEIGFDDLRKYHASPKTPCRDRLRRR